MPQALGQFRALVEGLHRQTLIGERQWTSASTKNTFATKVGDKRIEVLKEVSDRGSDIWIIVYDSTGTAVESFSDNTFGDLRPTVGDYGGYYPLMKDLFDAAGRNARGADKVISDLLNDLGLSEIQGGEDDIPF
ncbi:hypothetical protein AAG612_09075 [Citromicrobium bathyomarinum]|uniref:hypothetical protein n=1 Tax=Citromicrobium bathyomarinum TaxID=72174 RepID=UPI00315B33F2